MSHQVTIDFEGLSTRIKVQCENASHSLCRIDRAIELIKKNASRIENSKIKEYEDYLLNSKEQIQNRINSFTKKLEEYRSQGFGNRSVNLANDIKREGRELESIVNDLTGTKLAVMEQMVREGLIENIDQARQKVFDKVHGIKDFNPETLAKINSIEDISLREIAYGILSQGESNFDIILDKAEKEYDKVLKRTPLVEEIKEELRSSGVSQQEIEEITSKPLNANSSKIMVQEANSAITEEKIRKETLKIIIKAIKDRGFIVDTKNNLKIDKKRDIVILVAKKPDGKTAEFEISLNGKFMYHFDGYEGQACQKDIKPFIDDLKNIYDINILHEEVQWSNPDKIQTQKYQHMKTNKGNN